MQEILNLIRVASAARQEEITATDNSEINDIVDWQRATLEAAKSSPDQTFTPQVQALSDYLTCTNASDSTARRFATSMISEIPDEYTVFTSLNDWFLCINYVIQRAPDFNGAHFPMSKLFVFYMFSPSGNALFLMERFNQLLTDVLQAWCDYLDQPESRSVLNPSGNVPATDGWLSPEAQAQLCLSQSVNYQNHDNPDEPYWGFESYNGFFHREINLDEYRPLPTTGLDKVAVSANDGTVYRIANGVNRCDTFWMKGQPYSLIDMLGGTLNSGNATPMEQIEKFVGGDVIQSFLSGADYHRWHAPVTGTVISAEVIQGLTFSELISEGFDASAGTLSQGYQAMVNTRGLVIIEEERTKKLVAVMPIGITEISSVSLSVQAGQQVNMGQELGYFSYGGSTLVIAFEEGMVDYFTAKEAADNASFPPCKSADTCPVDQGCLRVRSEIAVLK